MAMPEYKNCRGCDQRTEATLRNGYCAPCSKERDGFAQAALNGLLAACKETNFISPNDLARLAFDYADAAMERRDHAY